MLHQSPRRVTCVALAFVMGAYGACWVLWDYWRSPTSASDFDYVWYAATALRHGLNPYAVIGPTGSWFHWYTPLYYPMPAILVAWPLSFLPLLAARCAFVGGSSALLFYGLLRTRGEWWWLLVALTGPFVLCARLSQWSILFTATLVLPALSAVYPCKPTLGAICALGQDPQSARRVWPWIVGGWVVLLGASFLALPNWLPWWLQSVHDSPHIKPLAALPGGAVLLLALIRWRQPEARLLAGYAVIPHTTVLYEALPAILVARTRLELTTLAALSGIAYAVQVVRFFRATDTVTPMTPHAITTLAFVYVPALVMVLRRPNVSPGTPVASPPASVGLPERTDVTG